MESPTPRSTVIAWAIGIIPVQSFISQAVRSRDLRAGSLLLSHMTARVIERIESVFEHVDVVLPRGTSGTGVASARVRDLLVEPTALMAQASTPRYSLPNRASGLLRGVSLDETQEQFSALEGTAITAAWHAMRQAASSGVDLACQHEDVRTVVRQAVIEAACPLQLIWCVREVALEGDGEAVSAALRSVEEAHSAVKRTRPLQVHAGAPVGKCPCCGERESMHKRVDGRVSWEGWRALRSVYNSDPYVVAGYRFDSGAMLCGVCAVKRLAGYISETPFPSTAAIAAAAWSALGAQVAEEELGELRRRIRALGRGTRATDIEPLYFERVLQASLGLLDPKDRAERAKHQSVLKAQREAAGAIGRSLGQDSPVLPSPYLAALIFDGDDMGKAVGVDPVGVSERVDAFAHELPAQLVRGATAFYIGGDEGLILSPVDGLLALALAIRSTWAEHVPDISLSMGVCIFDFARPLGRAIDIAHETCAAAKAQPGKDALGVSVFTASGSTWQVVGKWGAHWRRVNTAIETIGRGALASGWSYDLERALRAFPTGTFPDFGVAREALQYELKRLSRRHFTASQEPASPTEDFETLWSELGADWIGEGTGDPAELADQMRLIAFLQREARLPEVGAAHEVMA